MRDMLGRILRNHARAVLSLAALAYLMAIYALVAYWTMATRDVSIHVLREMSSIAFWAVVSGESAFLLCNPRRESWSRWQRWVVGLVEFSAVVLQVVLFVVRRCDCAGLVIALAGLFPLTRSSAFSAFPNWVLKSLPPRVGLLLPICLTFLLVSLVSFANPLMVYAHDALTFGPIWQSILFYGLLISAISSLVAAILAWILARKNLDGLWAWFLLSLVIVVFCYFFLIPSDFGTLQGATLVQADAMLKTASTYCLEFALLVGGGVVAWVLLKTVPGAILVSVCISLTVAFGLASVMPCVFSDESNPSTDKPPQELIPLRLSKTAPNVLVFLLDMVQGASFRHVMEDPHLASRLDGFVWFPNSLSASRFTDSAVPSIFGGEDGCLERLNLDTVNINGTKIRMLQEKMRNRIQDRGYDYAFCAGDDRYAHFWSDSPQTYDRKRLCELLGIDDYFEGDDYKPVLWGNALLHAIPYAYKPFVYNGGKWLCQRFSSYARDHLLYQALPRLTELHEGSRGDVIFFDAQLTHNPWGIPTEDGRFVQADSIQILKWTMWRICDYLDWMRRQGVYDNTRIILVSDHGLINISADDPLYAEDPILHKELWPQLSDGIVAMGIEDTMRIQAFNNLLAVKDFSARAPACRNDRLMGNSDIPDLILCKDVLQFASNLPLRRKTYVTHAPNPAGKAYDIRAVFEVKDNVFDLRNWTRVK